jgi:uncharacterized membrane protein YcfT
MSGQPSVPGRSTRAEERDPVPDIAKGIGILLVVLAHTIVPELRARYADLYAFWETISAFHMSVFSSSAVTCSSAG